MHGTRLMLALGLLLGAAGGGGCCKAAAKVQKEQEAVRAEYVASLGQVAAVMDSGDLPAPGAACPELGVKDEGYGGWDGYAQAVEIGTLGVLSAPAVDGKGGGEWAWLDNGWVAEMIQVESGKRKADNQTGSHAIMLARSPYLIVVTAERKAMPRATGKDSFEVGEFLGEMTVVERSPAKALCRVKLEVLSSDIVKYRKRGMFSDTVEGAIEKDFRKVFTEHAQAALATISPTLKVSF